MALFEALTVCQTKREVSWIGCHHNSTRICACKTKQNKTKKIVISWKPTAKVRSACSPERVWRADTTAPLRAARVPSAHEHPILSAERGERQTDGQAETEWGGHGEKNSSLASLSSLHSLCPPSVSSLVSVRRFIFHIPLGPSLTLTEMVLCRRTWRISESSLKSQQCPFVRAPWAHVFTRRHFDCNA